MTNYDAIKNLTSEQLERLLDQVFLTGLNTGHYLSVDPDIYDGNPFDKGWLNADAKESPALVEDETGESLIIEPLANVILRIVAFDAGAMPENVHWEMRAYMPKGIDETMERDTQEDAQRPTNTA